MPKSAVAVRAVRRHAQPRRAELPNVVEGQIAEICRDLAVEAKRMRQLQEQADELRRAFRRWARPLRGAVVRRRQLLVEDNAEQ
jgi:hypothetical protein